MDILSRCNNFLLDYGNVLEIHDYATQSSELEMGGWYWKTAWMCCGLRYITSYESTSRRCQSSLSLASAQG